MSGFLRKFFGQQVPQPSEADSDLEKFYTNSEAALRVFNGMATSTHLLRRILVIHGLGGVGKSTLLKMYVLLCRTHHIPAALAASEEAPSPVDVLAKWEADLNHAGISLQTFRKTLHHYRTIQAKVEAEAKKGRRTASQVAGTMGKTVVKSAIMMAASSIPVVGPLVGAVGGESAEVFVDWLRGFLSKPDMDIYLDPSTRLDSDFLNDLSRAAAHQRVVLMTDTYEQMTALDTWMRELVRKLPPNVLLVLAGRTVPAWDRSWPEWMGKAEIVELTEMTPDDIRTLVHRYYTYIRSGHPDSKQVEAIVLFARGLPIAATTVVQLWVKYGMGDFQTVRTQVVADLVDRLLEGVPPNMRPAFEVAAVLRYFNAELLHELTGDGTAESLYAELRRWPFVRPRREGLAVHDVMREMINEALSIRTPERFRALNKAAAHYYETRLETALGDELERYASERLYHRVRTDEEEGVRLFREQAERLASYRIINGLQILLNDVNTYPLEGRESEMWRAYYNARLFHLKGMYSNAEEVYQRIGEDERLEPQVRAYALCDWGEILCLRERFYQPGGREKAIAVLQTSLQLATEIDVKLAMNWLYLSDVYAAESKWERALSSLEQPERFFAERGDNASLLLALFYERIVYRRQGDYRKMLTLQEKMNEVYEAAGKPSSSRFLVSYTWEWILLGRCAEAEEELRSTLQVVRSLEEKKYIAKKSGDLSISLSFQGRCTAALDAAREALDTAQSLSEGDRLEVFLMLTVYGITSLKCGEFAEAEKYLKEAIDLGKRINAYLVSPSLYLAQSYEVLRQFAEAEEYYQLLLEQSKNFVQYYFICGGHTGMGRVKFARHDYAAIAPHWTEAERLARQFEYNDYFSSLSLIRGHIVWDNLIQEWESGFDAALHYYRQALIHALRFNRFLLDEALAGRELGTTLQPIIQHCQERGKEGRRMLLALRKWWQSGVNDIGVQRPDTISPVPEGLSLLEAEHIARQREPGDGSPQTNVVEQITKALQ